MARPKLDIDGEQVYKLAQLGCSIKEIGAFFECDPDTISKNYSVEIAKGQANLQMRVRRAQLRIMEEHNSAVMAIWLGKQILRQRDRDKEELVIEHIQNNSPEYLEELKAKVRESLKDE